MLLAALAAIATARTATAQLRMATWNITGLAGDVNAIRDVLGFIASDDLPGYGIAPHIVVFQEVEQGNQLTLRTLLQQATGVVYAVATYTNDGEDQFGGAQALLYRPDVLAEVPTGHRDIFTGAGRRADRWRMRWLAAAEPEATLWIYSAHLKASPGSANEAERLAGAEALRADIAGLPGGSNIILAGDLNLYSNTEPAFEELLSSGVNPLVDPLGGGPWNGPAFALAHTQSPRLTAGGGLVGGGMDDRFDFLLPASALQDGTGLAMLTEFDVRNYRGLGNDGNHYDIAINTGNNTYFPGDIPASNALADALHDGADHIPVVMDLQVPAVMTTVMPTSLGRIIRGTGFLVPASVENTTPVMTPEATDPLFVSWTATGALLGGGTILAEPLAGPRSFPAALATGTEGVVNGTIELSTTAEGVLAPSRSLSTTATIVRPSDPSFSGTERVTEREVTADADAGGPPIDIDVPVFNFDWSSLQSRLDLDAVDGIAGPLSLDGPLQQDVTAATVLSLRFDPATLEPGVVEIPLTITTSDENIPGEAQRSLTLLVRVDVGGAGNPYDLDGDGVVGFGDLLAVLSAFGACPAAPADCPADFDGSGDVGFPDLLQILAAFGT
jgi:endonuclease/exonuclease/phosphatase family metal-dependent hydrolase